MKKRCEKTRAGRGGDKHLNSSLSTCLCVPRPPEGPDDYIYIIRYDVLPKDTSVGLMLARGGSVQRSLQCVPTGEKKVVQTVMVSGTDKDIRSSFKGRSDLCVSGGRR